MYSNLTTKQRHNFPGYMLEVFEDIVNDKFDNPVDEEGNPARVGFFLLDSENPDSYLVFYYLRGEHFATQEYSYEDMPLDPDFYKDDNPVFVEYIAENDDDNDPGPKRA